MASLTGMEGFLGVDKDGAPIMAPTINTRSLGPKREALRVEMAPNLVPVVMPERAALTVHEILEAVTIDPPGSTVATGKMAKHPAGQKVLVQREFENKPANVQRSVATFKISSPGKASSVVVFRYTTPIFGIFLPK